MEARKISEYCTEICCCCWQRQQQQPLDEGLLAMALLLRSPHSSSSPSSIVSKQKTGPPILVILTTLQKNGEERRQTFAARGGGVVPIDANYLHQHRIVIINKKPHHPSKSKCHIRQLQQHELLISLTPFKENKLVFLLLLLRLCLLYLP